MASSLPSDPLKSGMKTSEFQIGAIALALPPLMELFGEGINIPEKGWYLLMMWIARAFRRIRPPLKGFHIVTMPRQGG